MVAISCQEWPVRGGEVLLLQNMLYCRAVRRYSGLCIVTGLNGWEASFVCAQQEDLGNAGKWYFCSSSVRIFRLKIQGQHRLLPAEEDTADRTQLAQGTQPRARVPHRVAGHLAPSGSLPTPPFFFFAVWGRLVVNGTSSCFRKRHLGYTQKIFSFLVVVYTEISFYVSRVFCKRETNPNLSPYLPTSRFVDALQDQNKDLAELPKVKHWGNGYRYSAFDLPNQLISSLQRNTLGCSCSRSKITGSPDQSRLMN